MYFVQTWSCPHCRCPLEVRLFALSSRLGPDSVGCLRCREPIPLDRREWPDMTGRARTRYVGVSLLYVVAVGVLAGNFLDQAVQLWEEQPTVTNLRYGAPVFQAAALAGALVVVLLQTYRGLVSRRRQAAAGSDPGLTAREFFLGLRWNLQAKCLLLLVLVWTVARVRHAL